MSSGSGLGDWSHITVVAFDVDGTLYSQQRLRLVMGRELLAQAARFRSLEAFRVLKAYRRLREGIGDLRTPDFETALQNDTARLVGVTPGRVSALVTEWMIERPLRHLPQCRYDGLKRLFDGLRSHKKAIGILSDYPAEAKLAALGLEADIIVTAQDVGILKPHPLGLLTLMERAGARPDQTVLIGDRPERDGEAAREAGAHVLIRSSKNLVGWDRFVHFDAPVFGPLLRPAGLVNGKRPEFSRQAKQ